MSKVNGRKAGRKSNCFKAPPSRARDNLYNAFHQVVTNYNALNEVTAYAYDGSQRLTNITHANGLVTTRNYGTNGFLSSIVDSYGGSGLRTNSYTWTNGVLLTHTDERGLALTHAHDALGRLVRVTYPDSTFITNTYDKLDLVRVQDRMSFTNQYQYNGFGQVTRAINANHVTTTNQYCDCGSLEAVVDPLGNTTSFTSDNLGRRTRTTFPGGSYVDSSFNLFGEVTRSTDNLGVSVTNFFNIQGLAYASSNAFGRVFLKSYDDHDRVRISVDANGVTNGFGYDDLGRLVVRTNYFTFDEFMGELDSVQDRFVYATNISGPVAAWREHYYAVIIGEWIFDAATNTIGRHITYAYDLFGRKTNEVHLGTNSTALMTNSFTYSAAGDLLTLRDGKAQSTTWRYDEYGRVTNKLDATTAEIFRYGYDANGRLTSRWTPAKGTTTYSYDAVGNLTFVNYPTSPDITLSYDALNRVTSMVDAAGTTSYGYTVFGTLQNEDGPWDSDTVSYSYTANRLRSGLSLTQPNATAWAQTYAYDAANRLTDIASPAGAFGYQYVSVGADSTPSQLIRRLSLLNGSAVTNQFDLQARWLITSLRNSDGTLLNQHSYVYDDLDQRTKQTRTGGDFVDYGYDGVGQLTSALGKESGGSTNRWQEQFGYAYDGAGNLNYRSNHTLLQQFNVDSLNQLTTVTNGGRLSVAGTTTSPATNVTVNTSNAIRYADHTFVSTNQPWVNGNNAFMAIAQDALGRADTNALTVSLQATNTFLYDQNGNLRTNGTRIFQYDDENQLICVTEPGAWMVTNVYDGKLRRRIERNYRWTGSAWVQTNEVRFVYDGNVVLQERNGFNLPVVTLTRGLDLSGSLQGAGGIGGLLATTESSPFSPLTSYFHSDANGNVTALVDTNQNVVARYLYDPFANTLSMTGPKAALNRYRFSSKPIHELSGMYDYLYRWYMPELQRWVNRDPRAEAGGVNLHAFIQNDPMHLVDFWGHKSACAQAKDQGDAGTDWGGVVCKDGKKHYCVWTPKNNDPGMDYCVGQHERDHDDDIECPNTCDGSVKRPKFKPGQDPDDEECKAYNIERDCLNKQKHASCGKRSGTDRAQCYQDFDNRLETVNEQISKKCNK